MERVEEIIELSTQVGATIRELSDLDGLPESHYMHRCIEIAHRVMQNWGKQDNFFQDGQLLPLPLPTQQPYPHITERRLYTQPHVREHLEVVSFHYAIDKQSVLAWGSDCKQLLEQALRRSPVIIRGPSGQRPFSLTWVKR